MRCKMPGKCDKFEEAVMVKRTHGENGIRSEEWGCEKRTKTMQTQRFAKKLYFYRNLFRNRLTKSRRDDKIYRQSAVAVKIESGRVPEWPMGTDCKSAAFQLRWFESTRAHQTRKIRTYFRLEKGSDFSFSSGTTTKVPVDGTKLRYFVIDRKPITRFGGYDYEVR